MKASWGGPVTLWSSVCGFVARVHESSDAGIHLELTDDNPEVFRSFQYGAAGSSCFAFLRLARS